MGNSNTFLKSSSSSGIEFKQFTTMPPNELSELSIADLSKVLLIVPSKYSHEMELIRRMTLPTSKTASDAQHFFHGEYSHPIIKVLARKHYIEDFVYARYDTKAYMQEVQSEYDVFIVEPDPETGVLYGKLVKYKEIEGKCLYSYVMCCSVRHFINLYKKRKRMEDIRLGMTDNIQEMANNFTSEEDVRILLYKAICPNDLLTNEEIVNYGNDLLDRVISFLPEKEKMVIQLTFFEGKSSVEAYDDIRGENDNVDTKNKQDYIAHLRARAIEHMKQIKTKLYGE